jgi:hypothetical protein
VTAGWIKDPSGLSRGDTTGSTAVTTKQRRTTRLHRGYTTEMTTVVKTGIQGDTGDKQEITVLKSLMIS